MHSLYSFIQDLSRGSNRQTAKHPTPIGVISRSMFFAAIALGLVVLLAGSHIAPSLFTAGILGTLVLAITALFLSEVSDH